MFGSFGVIGSFFKVIFPPRTLFFSPAAFWENVWFDMAFYRVDKTDARLAFPPCMQDSKLCLAAEHLVEGHPTSSLSG